MSTKPSQIARWCLDSTYTTDGANIAIPSSGQQDTGWTSAQTPPSNFWNWTLNLAARWQKYISDGAFSGGISVAGGALLDSLTVAALLPAGSATVTFATVSSHHVATQTAHGYQTGDGPITLSNVGGALPTGLTAATPYWPIRITADTYRLATTRTKALWKLDNSGGSGAGTGTHTATISASAIVGAQTHGDGPTASTDTGSSADDARFVGRLVVDGAVACADVWYSSIQTIEVHPASARTDGTSAGATYSSASQKWVGAGTTSTDYPIPLRVGDNILGYKLYLNKGSSAATTLTAALAANAAVTTPTFSVAGATDIRSDTNAANAPGDITIGFTRVADAVGYVVEAGVTLCIRVQSSTGSALDSWSSLDVYVIRGAP